VRDTPADVERRYHAMLMALSPGRRMAMAFGMFDAARALAEAGLRAAGVSDPREVRWALFLRFYGPDFGIEERHAILAAIDRAPAAATRR
jgi:hypothetical protein